MPIATTPIENGWVVIRNGIIVFVGPGLPAEFQSAKRYALDGYAILPGLINSHCHLEFSSMQIPIPAGNSFSSWIGQLLAYRSLQQSTPEKNETSRRLAIESGIRESYAAGVRWIIDMTTQPWDQTWIENAVEELLVNPRPLRSPLAPIVIQPCIEVLDVAQQRLTETIAFAAEQIIAPVSKVVMAMGYAPHAPYTTSLAATKLCVELANASQRLVTMHLGESIDEVAWLEHRSGGFQQLLGPNLDQDYFNKLGQVSEHLALLTTSAKAIVAHGNYLSESDLRELAMRSQSMAIVHCPRTHRHFGHRNQESHQYPLAERQSLGVRHLIGTDSRASNPDLNLWSEAKKIRVDHPEVASESILKMITLDAAEFLGIDHLYGSIRTGAPALLTAVKLATECVPTSQSHGMDVPYDLVLSLETISAPLELVLCST